MGISAQRNQVNDETQGAVRGSLCTSLPFSASKLQAVAPQNRVETPTLPSPSSVNVLLTQVLTYLDSHDPRCRVYGSNLVNTLGSPPTGDPYTGAPGTFQSRLSRSRSNNHVHGRIPEVKVPLGGVWLYLGIPPSEGRTLGTLHIK